MDRSSLASHTRYDIALTARTLRSCVELADRVVGWAHEARIDSYANLSDAFGCVDGDEQKFVNACHLSHVVTVLGTQLDAVRNGVMAPIAEAAIASTGADQSAIDDVDAAIVAGKRFIGLLDDIDVEMLWVMVSRRCASVSKTLRVAAAELESVC